MVNILEYISVAGLSAAALCLLLALLFAERPRGRTLRLIGIAVAVFAIALPALHLTTTLGRASPWVSPGEYTVHGWKVVEDTDRIYLLVSQADAEEGRQVEIPFDPELALMLQDFHRGGKKIEKLCLRVRSPGSDKPRISMYRIMGRTYMAECPQEHRQL